MKPVRFLVLSLIASVAVLTQPTVLAVNDHDPAIMEMQSSLMPGRTLPVLNIEAGGEIHVSDHNIVRRPWSSTCFEGRGKVQLVQYVAANLGVRKQNKAFNDSLREKRFTSDQMSTTIIVYMADTMEMLKGTVVKKLATGKARYQTIGFVIDDEGVGLKLWGIKNKSSAIIVLDKNGKVLFAKDGPLSDIEIESTIRLIESQIS